MFLEKNLVLHHASVCGVLRQMHELRRRMAAFLAHLPL
jgi:hypothetical protein